MEINLSNCIQIIKNIDLSDLKLMDKYNIHEFINLLSMAERDSSVEKWYENSKPFQRECDQNFKFINENIKNGLIKTINSITQ